VLGWLLGPRDGSRAALDRLRREERLLGCCEVEAFGCVLVVDRRSDEGWVMLVVDDGERWSTLDGAVFYSGGRAVRLVEGR
jgi:hypothetical protein